MENPLKIGKNAIFAKKTSLFLGISKLISIFAMDLIQNTKNKH